MKEAGIDVVRAVWCAEYEPLHVEPSADCPGYVRIVAKSQDAASFWGKVDFTMPPEMARELGKALIATADEQEAA
jgi:hypothetical protein